LEETIENEHDDHDKVEVLIMRVRPEAMTRFAILLLVAVCLTANAHAEASKADLRNELGITYAKEGHFEDALRSFSLVLAEDPEHAAALNNSANIYFVQGETERAQRLYERAIEAHPEEGGIRLNLGILLHSIGEEQESAARVRQGLELIGDPHEAYYILGLSTQRPSDNDRAADASELKASEIEDLLARAMADIPAGARKPGTESQTSSTQSTGMTTDGKSSAEPAQAAAASAPTIATRPGGAKASQVGPDIVADRLFWMSAPTHP
jgi:Tfp pilus assembly protein PilF